jgi:uncharacterized protein (TIGR00375 family)
MKFCADFHIHSRYSRATSNEMDIPHIAGAAVLKGIHLVGTGDFTHPTWREELKEHLAPAEEGIYSYQDVRFILTAEVNNTYTRQGRLRRIHNLIFAPHIEAAESITSHLERFGKLASDGRPTLTLDSEELVEIVLKAAPEAFIVPSHIWTPWFSLFGSRSGFDRIEDCFGTHTDQIFALETGLSSDPAMNWRLSALDRYTLISNSDAHSPSKLGREANFFDCDLSYPELVRVLKEKDREKFLFTVEFFPEEGKYHYDGHRRCKARVSPSEARLNDDLCPICGKPVTTGVLHRVEELSDRLEGFEPDTSIPFRRLVPLAEIIADALSVGVDTQGVRAEYHKIVKGVGSEFAALLDVPLEDLSKVASPRVAEGVKRVREGKVHVLPGYDGVFGKVRIFAEDEPEQKQLSLF